MIGQDWSVIKLSILKRLFACCYYLDQIKAGSLQWRPEWFVVEDNDICVVPASSEVLEQYAVLLTNNESIIKNSKVLMQISKWIYLNI